MSDKTKTGYIKRIHVNQHHIKANASDGGDRPVITVKLSDDNLYGHEVILRDAFGYEVGRLVYRPETPLGCGARVWLETKMAVTIVNRTEETDDNGAEEAAS